jgi:hypothetical protein
MSIGYSRAARIVFFGVVPVLLLGAGCSDTDTFLGGLFFSKDAGETAAPTPETSPAPATSGEPRPAGEAKELFRIGNGLAVFNGGASPTVTFDRAYYLTEITTYHWNGGAGTSAGTIALKDASGKNYGPWQAELVNGVYWTARPGETIPSGKYTVIDSDPSTWAQNESDGGLGMTWASGITIK